MSAFGQSYSLGVKAGVSLNWAAFGDRMQKDTFATRLMPGYTAGVTVGFPMKNDFDFLAEASFTQKGRRLKFNEKTWENRSVYHMVEATMLLRRHFHFYLEKNVPSEWFFTIGPEVSYWLASRGKIIAEESPGARYDVVFDAPPDGALGTMYYNDVNRWLFGLIVGVGFKAPLLPNQHIATELRFHSGHTYLGTRSSSSIAILGYDDTMLTNLKAISIVATYTFDFNVQESRKGKSTIRKRMKRR